MGTIASQFSTAFRDFVTDGVSSSGAHDVVKSEVRAIGALIEAALGSVAIGALASVAYATKAELLADLAHAAASVGLVYADATELNNDLYIKAGASGAGSWTQTTILHDLIENLAQPYVDAAEAAQSAAEATATAIGNINEQLYFYSASELELWPGDRQLVVDAGGYIARNFSDYAPSDIELWDDALIIVDAGGYVADRSTPPVFPEVALRDPARLERAAIVFPKPIIAGIGHSMITQGQAAAVATYLTGALGSAIGSKNFGRSGNTARGIAARVGAYYPGLAPRAPTYLPTGGVIPATITAVTLIPTYGSIDAGPWESFGGTIPTITETGSFGGIWGTFQLDSGSGLRFTRAAVGTEKAISEAVPIFPDVKDGGDAPSGAAVADYRELTWLIWLNRNSMTDTTRGLQYMRALVAHIRSVNAQFVILPDFPQTGEELGTAGRTSLNYWNELLRSEWPDQFCADEYGVSLLDWAINAGPNATDKANGLISSEWRADSLHLNNLGRSSTAPFIGDFMIRKGMIL